MKLDPPQATFNLEALRRAKKLLMEQRIPDEFFFWCPYCHQTTDCRKLPCCDAFTRAVQGLLP